MPDSFDLPVECPKCGAEFTAPAIAVGTTEKCPVCGADVQVTRPRRGASVEPEPIVELRAEDVVEDEPPSPRGAAASAPVQEGFTSRFPRDPAGLCYVCLAAETRVNVPDVATLIQGVTGVNRHDATALVKNGMGVLTRTDAGRARRVVEAVASKGLTAFVMDAALIPNLLPARRVHQVRPTGEGLLSDPDNPKMRLVIPWASIVAAACSVYEGTEETYVPSQERGVTAEMPGVANRYRPGAPTTVYRKRKDAGLIVLAVTPSVTGWNVTRLVFNQQEIGYEFLGPATEAPTHAKFKLFCASVLSRLTRAFLPESTRAFVFHARDNLPTVAGRIQADWYHRWLLCCGVGRFGPFG